MGYESKIYVVKEYSRLVGDRMPYGEVVAVFDLCKMGWDEYNGTTFRGLFDEDRSCDFYADDGNSVITEDCYGDEVQKADMCKVLRWLNKFCENDDYWRARVFRKYLLSLEEEDFYPSLYHYGY